MGKALYREYRPKSLAEVVGQEHITTALANAIKAQKINHAYLFTGPRGVGKTSIARILAHEVNGLPYDDDSAHLDIIEIDAASNRRIEEIRDLRDKVHISPTQAKYKVYIIDEVHMLTREAFNALLKTLEEPPQHVIFILATTEAHKLPETIISRCMHFSFKPIDAAKIVEHLRFIATKEGLTIDDDSLRLIAEHGEGSFRDSIGLLDQAGNMGEVISLEDVTLMLGIAPQTAIEQLAETLAAGDIQSLITLLDELRQRGFHAPAVAKQLSRQLRQALLGNNYALEPSQLIALLRQLLDVPTSADPEASLELTLLDMVLQRPNTAPMTSTAATHVEQATTPPSPKTPPPPNEKPAPKPPELTPPKASKKPAQHLTDFEKIWPEVLASLKQTHNTLYGIVRIAEPSFDGKILTLGFRFAFHQKRINETKNKQIITELIMRLSGQQIRLECVVQKSASKPIQIKDLPKPLTTDIDTISNIFGGAELLDS